MLASTSRQLQAPAAYTTACPWHHQDLLQHQRPGKDYKMPNSCDPRERPRSMSTDRTKRGLNQDSEDEDTAPPTKVRAPEAAISAQDTSTTCHQEQDQDEGFRLQGREYVRARRDKYEQMKTRNSQSKENLTSQPQPNNAPKILIPATEGFQSPVDVAEALEEELHLQGKLPMKFLHSGQVLISPPTKDTHDIIVNLRELKGKAIRLQEVSHSTTKGVLLRYPLLMPLSIIQKNPAVISAERLTTRDGEETRQVMITVKGPLPGSLDLGNWGTFYTRPYSKEPLRCYNCQKFGHHKANCTLPPKCGVCAGKHDTAKCIKTHKDGGETTAKCPNCNMQHHAWNKNCSARREIVETQRATQHQWMIRHRPALANPTPWQGRSALAATSTWGSRSGQPATPPQQNLQGIPPTEDQFPALGAAASQPRTSSRPRQRIKIAPASALPPTPPPRQRTDITTAPTQPPPPPPQADHITLSKTDLKEMFQTFATALVSMLGMEIPETAITTLTEKVVSRATKQQPTTQQPLAGPNPPVWNPRRISPSPSRAPLPKTGVTPASANIEREKAALGLTQEAQVHQKETTTTQSMNPTTTTTPPPKTQEAQITRDPTKKKGKHHKKEEKRSKSCNGTASQSRTSYTC